MAVTTTASPSSDNCHPLHRQLFYCFMAVLYGQSVSMSGLTIELIEVAFFPAGLELELRLNVVGHHQLHRAQQWFICPSVLKFGSLLWRRD